MFLKVFNHYTETLMSQLTPLKKFEVWKIFLPDFRYLFFLILRIEICSVLLLLLKIKK